MATRVFADEELERLQEFPGIGRDELFRHFTLTDADRASGGCTRVGCGRPTCRGPRVVAGLGRGRGLRGARAVDAFLDSPKINGNVNTRRAYAGVLDRAAELLDPDRALAARPTSKTCSPCSHPWSLTPSANTTRLPPPRSPHRLALPGIATSQAITHRHNQDEPAIVE